jgi:hypothetical protein
MLKFAGKRPDIRFIEVQGRPGISPSYYLVGAFCFRYSGASCEPMEGTLNEPGDINRGVMLNL